MADCRLERIREAIRLGYFSVSEHVFDDIANNEFELEDIEWSLLTGEIIKNQRDELRTACDGRKYTILGRAKSGLPFFTVGKIVESEDGRAYFVITAYYPERSL